MQSALRQISHPAEFVALGGDEQRMALDSSHSFYTASEFCNFDRDQYMVDALIYAFGRMAMELKMIICWKMQGKSMRIL